jgi:hypothetical protein
MAKLTLPSDDAAGLSVRERVLLLCVASNTDWQRAGVPNETVIAMIVKGLIKRGAAGHLALTDRGRAVLRAMLPGL